MDHCQSLNFFLILSKFLCRLTTEFITQLQEQTSLYTPNNFSYRYQLVTHTVTQLTVVLWHCCDHSITITRIASSAPCTSNSQYCFVQILRYPLPDSTFLFLQQQMSHLRVLHFPFANWHIQLVDDLPTSQSLSHHTNSLACLRSPYTRHLLHTTDSRLFCLVLQASVDCHFSLSCPVFSQ